VAVITIRVNDAPGRRVPAAAYEIIFALGGPGKIIGVGNGDPSSHEPEQLLEADGSPRPVWRRRRFNGLAQVIVPFTGQPGAITLTATASGLAEPNLSVGAAQAK